MYISNSIGGIKMNNNKVNVVEAIFTVLLLIFIILDLSGVKYAFIAGTMTASLYTFLHSRTTGSPISLKMGLLFISLFFLMHGITQIMLTGKEISMFLKFPELVILQVCLLSGAIASFGIYFLLDRNKKNKK